MQIAEPTHTDAKEWAMRNHKNVTLVLAVSCLVVLLGGGGNG